MTDNVSEQATSSASSGADRRRMIAIPLIMLAAALVGVGIYQVAASDDPVPIEPEVGGQQVTRDDAQATTAPSTTVVVGDDSGLEVGGDQGQVGLLPAQSEER